MLDINMKRLIALLAAVLLTVFTHDGTSAALSRSAEDDPFLTSGLTFAMAGYPFAVPVHNCDVYRGFLSGDMNIWIRGITAQEELYRKSRSNDDLFVLILSKYGYIGFIIGMKKSDEARDMLASAEENVEILAKDKAYTARATALRGALIAMRISLNPLKATYLGMRSLRQMEEALKIDSNDPTGWVEMGNARYHMPSVVGGSYKESVRCFSQAITLFEKNPASLKCNWHYLHALVWLAQSHDKLGDLAEAKRIYEKILKIEPEFQWVKRELYPDLIKRAGQPGTNSPE
jgi:tetratricopeptide (TPR) repeat protein